MLNLNSQGCVTRSEMRPLRPPRVPVPQAYSHRQCVNDAPQDSDRNRLKRAAEVLLLVFCLGTAIGLVHVIGISHQMLSRLEAQELVQPQLMHETHEQSKGMVGSAWARAHHDGEGANVLIAYSDGPHLSKLAQAVEVGARHVLGNKTASVRIRTLEDVSFTDDVMWADAVILGTHVVNANVEPKMTKFLSEWSITEDLSRKVGAVFVTSGGISAGEELTMVNLLHSLMIFRIIIVGGERWTSAFGASAIVGEGPFQPAQQTSPGQRDFPPICYPTDPDTIHGMFKDKAIGLGERAASLASQLRRTWTDSLNKTN
ncbi:hypothetical protein BBO99_00000551 [Phytophthora kernoviae]|uniref:NADPH-dependent FMN reductase-like domain-containing protein n=2 Tax=Phytophthora kernoviae TaxID=325452 RepID=A0A421F672_9STRA|nr:hypothetical protein G195_001462 [Phytophthora kernoviae 00238/432]KAG2532110.1 hypothetical protein JM16_000511 [Phytophthora kernoviae]RLN26096.1 hypothetical protein BBI17_000590 [Phytophthora kernoviae]RLN85503.1 hypothetical protein BBO99_00000551 [Phytophthora kernoviae]